MTTTAGNDELKRRTGGAEEARGAALLRLARESLEDALIGGRRTSVRQDVPPWLRESGATFVTLRRHGELRGCVGSVEAVRPLIEDVRRNAVSAALRDPRFTAVTPEELGEIALEVTLLSPLEPLHFTSEDEALAALTPGRDGLVLSWREHHATYLPQVWEDLPEPEDFLVSLKRKAGLASDFWHPEIELSRYFTRHWCEGDTARPEKRS